MGILHAEENDESCNPLDFPLHEKIRNCQIGGKNQMPLQNLETSKSNIEKLTDNWSGEELPDYEE